MAKSLATPLLDLGIENPNFFEGRLLTAAALKADQEANRARQRQLGRAVGAGVVEGLWVTLVSDGSGDSDPVVAVSRGLAFNHKGQALEIAKEKEEITLTEAAAASLPADAGLFRTCSPPSAQVAATGEGVYVLVLSPASGFGEETAPMSGLGSGKIAAGCGRKWAVEGVQVRLVALNPLTVSGIGDATKNLLQTQLLGATSAAGLSQLRNVLAHLCFGTETLARWAADPFATEAGEPGFTTYGALDDLRSAGQLTECDVPLALVHWTLGGVSFVDNWSVRRCPAPPACDETWPTLSGGRRRAEGEAMLFQFQEQLAALLAEAQSPDSIEAEDYFLWLPPAGLMPLRTAERFRGLRFETFLDGITVQGPDLLPRGARLRSLLSASLDFPAWDVAAAEVVRVYVVGAGSPSQGDGELEHAVFAGELLPYFGDVLDLIDALEERVAALEAAGEAGVAITGVTGSRRIGGELTVLGRNFEEPARFNTVTIGGIPVTSFNPGTDDRTLIFNVPVVPGVPTEATLVVSNRNGPASWQLVVLPAAQPQPEGEVLITERLEDLEGVEITAGGTFLYSFEIDSQTSSPETYTLEAVFRNPVGAALDDWDTAATVVDMSGGTISSIEVSPGQPQRVGVEITIPAGAVSVELVMRVRSLNNPDEPMMNRDSGIVLIEVETVQEISDPRIVFGPAEVVGAGSLDPADGAIVSPAGGGETLVRVNAEFEVAGEYVYSLNFLPDPDGWSIVRFLPDPPTTIEDASGEQQIVAGIELAPGGDPAGQRLMEIRVSRQDADAVGPFESFVRLPIRGS